MARKQYRLEFTPRADKDLRKLTKEDQERISPAIDKLSANPRPSGHKVLKGKKLTCYRIRVGPFRVVYCIEDEKVVVLVLRIGDRKEIYKLLDRLQE